MDCPMEIPVFYDGQELCRLRVEQVGLYYRFACRCRLRPARIMRIYAVQGFSVTPVGILMPVRDEFVLNEKISVRAWQLETIDAAVCGYAPEEGALPWRGEIDGVTVDGCWIRPTKEGYALLFAENAGAFPLPAALLDAEACQCGNVPCAMLRIDGQGNILHQAMPEAPEPSLSEDVRDWAPEEMPAT